MLLRLKLPLLWLALALLSCKYRNDSQLRDIETDPMKPVDQKSVVFVFDASGAPGEHGVSGATGSRGGPAPDSFNGLGLLLGTRWLPGVVDTSSFTRSPLGAIVTAASFFAGPAAQGARGDDGRDGGPATPGENAGNATLDLSYMGEPTRGVVQIVGQMNLPPSRAGQAATQQTNIDLKVQSGYVYVNLTGGAGGWGGDAGPGGQGGPGHPGRDADTVRAGTNGGPGGDGGDAGNPTDGQRGGNGGKLTVNVGTRDLGLLMLVKAFTKQGDGGRAGEMARGGPGGPGGPGGQSHVYWRKYEDQEDYRDANGNWQRRTVTKRELVVMPGGSDGPTGDSGRGSTYRAKAGEDGTPGDIVINVHGEDGSVETYERIYSLALLKYDLVSANADSVIEPGEHVLVKNLRIKNTGGMPTPPNYPVRIYLVSNDWVISSGEPIIIKDSIPAGGEYDVPEDQALEFTVKDLTISEPGAPFRVTDTVRPLATLAGGIERPFEEFPLARDFTISFAIEMTPISTLTSLAPGEKAKMTWRITNVSQRDFGPEDLNRLIKTELARQGGDIPASAINFYDKDGRQINLGDVNFLKEIIHLKKGESALVEGLIELRPDAPIEAYQQATVRARSSVTKPTATDIQDTRVVQMQDFTIRAAQAYRKSPDANYLLIVNHNTTWDELQAWRDSLASVGESADVLDISYYGLVDLARTMQSNPSLLKQWAGRNIVVLNNEYADAKGPTRAADQLAKAQLGEALMYYGINFYVLGPSDPKTILGDALVPRRTKKGETTSLATFMDRLQKEDELQDGSGEQPDGQSLDAPTRRLIENYSERFHKLEFSRWLLWGQPKEDRLAAEAERLQSRLQRAYPARQFVVVYRFEPSVGDRLMRRFFFRPVNYGTLEVRRTVNRAGPKAIAYTVTDDKVHSPEFIRSREHRRTLLLGADFDKNLDRFAKILGSGLLPNGRALQGGEDAEAAETGEMLIEVMLADLAAEQTDLRMVGGADASDSLQLLKLVGETLSSLNVGEHPLQRKLQIDFLAKIKQLVRSPLSFWNFFLPWGKTRSAVRQATQEVQRVIEGVSRGNGEFVEQVDARVGELVAETREALAKAQDEAWKAGRRSPTYPEWLLDQTLLPAQAPDVNAKLAQDIDGKVLSLEDYEKVLKAGQKQTATIRRRGEANVKARKEALDASACEAAYEMSVELTKPKQ